MHCQACHVPETARSPDCSRVVGRVHASIMLQGGRGKSNCIMSPMLGRQIDRGCISIAIVRMESRWMVSTKCDHGGCLCGGHV